LPSRNDPNNDLDAASPYLYPRNPCGRGYLVEATPEGFAGLRLPQLEDPGDPLTAARLADSSIARWQRLPLPWSTGWVNYSWYPRIAFLGVVPCADEFEDPPLETAAASARRRDGRAAPPARHARALELPGAAAAGPAHGRLIALWRCLVLYQSTKRETQARAAWMSAKGRREGGAVLDVEREHAGEDATDARPCCCFTPRRMSCITARASRPATAASSGAS